MTDILPNIKSAYGFWLEYNDYWLYNAPQRSDDWHKVRLGRPSGSSFAACIGDSKYNSPMQMAKYICKLEEQIFDERQLKNMNHGTEHEPYARKYYEDLYYKNTGYKVIEVGYVIPKWNYDIGVSVDGIVLDKDNNIHGIIEIKCPVKMYKELNSQKDGSYSHIKKEHYQQMHLGMAVIGVKWCDYVVYSTSENTCYTERIPFNEEYWKSIYMRMINFIQTLIKPNVNKNNMLYPPH